MPIGVAFSLCAYFLYSCCDAIIKGFGSSLSVYEIAFFCALFSFLPAIVTKPKGEHWRHALRMRHPYLVHARAVMGLIGNICIIYSFVTIPLAEAYSLAFLAPIFVVGLSALLLRETVGWPRWLFLLASFCGVLLVVRPGFRDLHLGHLTAVLAAMCGAVTTTALRKVAPVEKRVSLIGVPLIYVLIVNAVLMAPTFQMPSLKEFGFFLAVGLIGGTSNIIFIAATRRAAASQIAPAQYSQIVWAILFGAIFYAEYPDMIAYFGLAAVALSGVMNVISDETRIRIFSRLSPGLGPATAMAEVSPPLDNELSLKPRPPSSVAPSSP